MELPPFSEEPASVAGDPLDDLRVRLTDLDHASRRSPEDIGILKESVLVCEQMGDEEEAARYRFRIWRIDPGEPSLQGKEIAQRTPRIEAPESLRLSFREDWPRVWRYPMEGWGRATLIGGAILMALGRTLGDVPIGSSLTLIWIGVATIFWIITWGTLASYWLQIVEASAMGKEEPPEWTDFRDFWSSMFGPFFSMLFCLTLTLGPALAWLILCGNQMGFNIVTVTILILLILGGVFLLPMVLLGYSRFKQLSQAVRPGFLFGSIGSVLPEYLRLQGLVLGVIAANALLSGILGLLQPIPYVGFLLYVIPTSFLWMYLAMIGFHLLGRFYLRHAEKLNWFDELIEAEPPEGTGR